MPLSHLTYYHADVFTRRALSGNGLAVFPVNGELSSTLMQRLTQEMRQFESIFLMPADSPNRRRARIFTMEEELDFAGHPVLGAATVLHYLHQNAQPSYQWELILPAKTVKVTSEKHVAWYTATMDQPVLGSVLSNEESIPFIRALNLSLENVDDAYPLRVISTGLPYLIVPVRNYLERARIIHPEFEKLLSTVGAKFVYVFDVHAREGRTWDNAGLTEDIATGSAAGPAGVYLVNHQLAAYDEPITLQQGRFAGRPSRMAVRIASRGDTGPSVLVSGEVCVVARGEFLPCQYRVEPRSGC